MEATVITLERLAHLRGQKEAALEAAHREHVGLLQALGQNQARQRFLEGQLALLEELATPAPTDPPTDA